MYSNRICTKSPIERARDRPVGKRSCKKVMFSEMFVCPRGGLVISGSSRFFPGGDSGRGGGGG